MRGRNFANSSGDWSGAPVFGSRACKCTIAAPASAAPMAASAICVRRHRQIGRHRWRVDRACDGAGDDDFVRFAMGFPRGRRAGAVGGKSGTFLRPRLQAYDFTTLSLAPAVCAGQNAPPRRPGQHRPAKSFEPADGPPLPTLVGSNTGPRVQKGSKGISNVHHDQDRCRFAGCPHHGRRDDLRRRSAGARLGPRPRSWPCHRRRCRRRRRGEPCAHVRPGLCRSRALPLGPQLRRLRELSRQDLRLLSSPVTVYRTGRCCAPPSTLHRSGRPARVFPAWAGRFIF